LDEITGGIVPTLICLYGRAASLKTTLSSYVPICRIYSELSGKGELRDSHVFIVIDGDGGWDRDRASEIWESNGLNPEDIMQHVKYFKVPGRFSAQHEMVKELSKTIEKNDWVPLLIALDPAVATYRGEILRSPPHLRALKLSEFTGKLDLQLAELRKIGVVYDIPIFVTSWPASPLGKAMRESQIRALMDKFEVSREEADKMVPKPESDILGGRIFEFLPKIIVRLEIPDESRPFIREAYLKKHRGKPAGLRARFKVTDKGVEDL